MPIYEYACFGCKGAGGRDHRFERIRHARLNRPVPCPLCGRMAEKQPSAPSVHFKGSGFYATDYARHTDKGGRDVDG